MSIKMFEGDGEGLDAWLKERAEFLKIRTREVPIVEVRESWTFALKNLAIQAITSAFFGVIGVEVSAETSNREVRRWQQLMLQDQGGEVGLVLDGAGNVLVRARPEPGQRGVMILIDGVETPSRVLAALPIQFSLANLMKHGPDKVPFADLITDSTPLSEGGCNDVRPKDGVRRISQEADGGRFFEKRNYYSVVTVDRETFDRQLAARPDASDFAWIDRATFRAGREKGLFNEHMCIGMSALL